jgi:hypothetical protein
LIKKKGDHLHFEGGRPSRLEVKGGWGLKPLIQEKVLKNPEQPSKKIGNEENVGEDQYPLSHPFWIDLNPSYPIFNMTDACNLTRIHISPHLLTFEISFSHTQKSKCAKNNQANRYEVYRCKLKNHRIHL